MTQFRDNEEKQRFEWHEDGHVSFCDYRVGPDRTRALLHVETPAAARGKGAAGRLMDAIMAHARSGNYRLRPICSYAVAHLRRHRAQDLWA